MTNSMIAQVTLREWTFWTSTVVASVSQVALIGITFTLATTHIPQDHSIYAIALLASVSNILALVASTATTILYVRRSERRVTLVLYAVFVLLATFAALLSVYTLGGIWNNPQEIRFPTQNFKSAHGLTGLGFAIWVVGVVAQLFLCILFLWPEVKSSDYPSPAELEDRSSPVRSMKRVISAHLTSITPPPSPSFSTPVSEPLSSAFSDYSVSLRSSFRQAVSQAMKPVTSKTKLIVQHSLFKDSHCLHSGRDSSLDTARQGDGFVNWDTSAVEVSADHHAIQKSARTRFEPIPGSRPVSPARPLDGPFLGYLNESLIQSLVGSPSSETSSLRLSLGHGPQSSIDQAHIHPLVRSESPGPPPLTSPGTVITASPYAGQVVSPNHQNDVSRRLHSAQSNRAESPCPLSPPRNRQGSCRSFGIQSASPVDRPTSAARSYSAILGASFEE